MCDSLLKLQDLLESGNKLSNQDILAISRGFTNFNECSRYRKWRRNEGKSTFYEDDDFTSDLEWWRIHVDYSTVSTFIEYAKKHGYTVTREVLSKFQKWSYHKGLTHSNSEEYLALYVEYLNVLSKRDSIEEVLFSLPEGSSKEDAIAVSLGFKDCKERRVYDGTCRRLGFTYSSDKDRYLNGIADWKRQKNLKKNNKRSTNVSSFFSSKMEHKGFLDWCYRSNIDVHSLSNNELKETVELYREKSGYLGRKKNLPWKDDFQKERYRMYSTKRGFSFKTDPERYLAEFQNWSDNIDAEESSNYLRYCELFKHLLLSKENCEDLDNYNESLLNLFDSIDEKYYFYKWCSNTNKVVTTKEELLSALNLYRKLGEYKSKLKGIRWVSSNQKQRYYRYCKNLGFSFTSDPERYLAGIRKWASAVDKKPLVD